MARLLVLVIIIAAVAAGIYYMGQGKHPMDALQEPVGVVQGNSSSDGDLYSAADTLYMKSEYDSCIATYRKAISKSPGDARAPEGAFRIADSYEKSNRPNDALKAYKDFVASYPGDDRLNKVQKRIDYLSLSGAK